tara:strand:+ start:32625 stop:33569 length:945 start_codon:yes stop_codon:yes gene_type:complete
MRDKLRVVFMGTPDFAVPTLEVLIHDDRFNVIGVVTQPDRPKGRGNKLTISPVKSLSLKHNLNVYQPNKIREQEMVEKLSALSPDFLVVVAYGQILSESILQIPKYLSINLHASLLPRWRGAAPIHRAFIAGDKLTGVCTMIMEKGLDTGDTLLSEHTAIEDTDTVETLHDRMALMGSALLAETLIGFVEGRIEKTPQDSEGVTYAGKLGKKDFEIDWTKSSAMVSRHIRGLSPFPGSVTILNGRRLKLLFALAREEDESGDPGVILSLSESGIQVACGKGSILITELKPDGKGKMSAHSYTLGRALKLGDRFG